MRLMKKRTVILFLLLLLSVWIFFSTKNTRTINDYKSSHDNFYYEPNDHHCPTAIFETPDRVEYEPTDECQQETGNWIDSVDNYAIFKQSSIDLFGPIECMFKTVSWRNDFESMTSQSWLPLLNNSYLGTNILFVRCKGRSLLNYREQFLFGHENRKRRSQQRHLKDILIVGIDSVSRLAWKRLLRKSYGYLESHMNRSSVIFKKVNVIGDGTTVNVLGILAGELEMEIYESRRGFPGAKTVDEYPWIWGKLKQDNYATYFDEDDVPFGIFQYRLLGFHDQPTDFYGRVWRMIQHLQKRSSPCIGNKNIFEDQLRNVRSFYRNGNSHKFAFVWSSIFSHDVNEEVSVLDSSLLGLLEEVNRPDGMFNNTIFILMSDHGHRFNSRLHLQGKFEERLPFLAINLPASLRKDRPKIFENMKNNENKLITTMDVYESLVDMHNNFTYTVSDNSSVLYRMSLFNRDLPLRSCSDVKIATHWCSCLKWIQVDPKQKAVKEAAQYAISVINDFTKEYRSICQSLELDQVLRSHLVSPSKDVLKFHNSDGHGRVPNMSDNTKVDSFYYRISWKTKPPGNAIFETTVSVKVKTMSREYGVLIGDIDRSNKYSDWIWCIKPTMKDIRKYCICK